MAHECRILPGGTGPDSRLHRRDDLPIGAGREDAVTQAMRPVVSDHQRRGQRPGPPGSLGKLCPVRAGQENPALHGDLQSFRDPSGRGRRRRLDLATELTRGSSVVEQLAHIQTVGGSSPPPATNAAQLGRVDRSARTGNGRHAGPLAPATGTAGFPKSPSMFSPTSKFPRRTDGRKAAPATGAFFGKQGGKGETRPVAAGRVSLVGPGRDLTGRHKM